MRKTSDGVLIACLVVIAIAWLYWASQLDTARTTAYETYTHCVEREYHFTPSEYKSAYNTLPVCQ